MSLKPQENAVTQIVTREEAVEYARRRHFDEGASQIDVQRELTELGYVTRTGIPPSQGAIWTMLFPEKATALRLKREKKMRRKHLKKLKAQGVELPRKKKRKKRLPRTKPPVVALVTTPPRERAKSPGASQSKALLAVRAVLEHPDLDGDTKVEIALQLMKKL